MEIYSQGYKKYRLYTITDIAEEYNLTSDNVSIRIYRKKIKPDGYVGQSGVYGVDKVKRIVGEK